MATKTVPQCATAYIEHDAGENVVMAVNATLETAIERCGGKDGLVAITANAHGVQWRREWALTIEEPEPEAEVVELTAGDVGTLDLTDE